jgi:hypothetical protein
MEADGLLDSVFLFQGIAFEEEAFTERTFETDFDRCFSWPISGCDVCLV